MSTLSRGKLLQDLTAVIAGAPAGLVLPKVSDRIVEAFESAPDTGVLSLDGEMLDRPHLVPAQCVLALARHA